MPTVVGVVERLRRRWLLSGWLRRENAITGRGLVVVTELGGVVQLVSELQTTAGMRVVVNQWRLSRRRRKSRTIGVVVSILSRRVRDSGQRRGQQRGGQMGLCRMVGRGHSSGCWLTEQLAAHRRIDVGRCCREIVRIDAIVIIGIGKMHVTMWRVVVTR